MRLTVAKLSSPTPRDSGVRHDFFEGDVTSKKDDATRAFDSISKSRAESLLKNVSPEVGFKGRLEFIELLAALAKIHPETVGRKYNSGKTLRAILMCAGAESHFEWLCNWTRLLQQQQKSQRLEPNLPIATGTAGNEALHSQVMRCFSNVIQVHQPTMTLKLRILGLKKLICHNNGAFHTTTTTVTEKLIAYRAIASLDPWNGTMPIVPPPVALNVERKELQMKIRAKTSLKAPSQPNPNRKITKPTIYTKKRSSPAVATPPKKTAERRSHVKKPSMKKSGNNMNAKPALKAMKKASMRPRTK